MDPPVVKPCEPPAGLAKLADALKYHGIDHQVIDANFEGISFLRANADIQPEMPASIWTKRAFSHLRCHDIP